MSCVDSNSRFSSVIDMPPRYLHQWPDWPTLAWEERALATRLGRVRHFQDRLLDRTQSLDFEVQQQVTLETLTSGVVKSSAIEGETLDPARVRSSIVWCLGDGGVPSGDQHKEGVVRVTLDSTQRYDQASPGHGFSAGTPLCSPQAAVALGPYRWRLPHGSEGDPHRSPSGPSGTTITPGGCSRQ